MMRWISGIICFNVFFLMTSSQEKKRISIQEVTVEAVRAYKGNDFEASIKSFETALVHYKMMNYMTINCRFRCNSPNISKELNMDVSEFEDLSVYGNIIAQANCMKICKEEHPFSSSNIERPREDFVADFEKREPYNYLQFAYYKTGQIKKACQAAHTYYQANPGDEQMRDNIAYYKGLDEVKDDFFVDLEEKPFVEYFRKGAAAYEKKNDDKAVKLMEKALSNYLEVRKECTSLCFVGEPQTEFHMLHQHMSGRYRKAVNCSLNCDAALRPLIGDELLENIVAKIFSYLQFSYHQLGNWTMATPAAASVLLLSPEDEVAQSNYAYYKENGEVHGLVAENYYKPREDAVKYHLENKINKEILALMEKAFDYDDEDEVEEEELGFSKENLIQEIKQQITVTLGERLKGDIG